jgi:ankyrin repeat protein
MKMLCASLLVIFFGLANTLAAPIHDAARDGDRERVAQLITTGADITEPDESGEPPLLLGALRGRLDVVALLLEKGADIEIRNKGGLTALHAAAYGGHLDVVELLLSKGARIDDQKNFYHISPLHAAAEEGRLEVIAVLLANRADIEAKERNGYTPVTEAGWRSHWQAAEILLHAGAVCQSAELVGEQLYNECIKRKQ